MMTLYQIPMTFDINALDNCVGDWYEALDTYTDELVELFAESPEGQAHYERMALT